MDKRLIDMAKYRLERAKQDLSDAEYNYKGKRYLNAIIEHIILYFMQLEQSFQPKE